MFVWFGLLLLVVCCDVFVPVCLFVCCFLIRFSCCLCACVALSCWLFVCVVVFLVLGVCFLVFPFICFVCFGSFVCLCWFVVSSLGVFLLFVCLLACVRVCVGMFVCVFFCCACVCRCVYCIWLLLCCVA